MNESMLNSLMRLFAIMVNIDRTALHLLARNFVEDFLMQQFSPRIAEKYLELFDQYSSEYKVREKQKEGKKRMRQVGQVEVPQEAFLAVLSMTD